MDPNDDSSDPCQNAMLTIDNTILTTLDIEHPINGPADTQTLLTSLVTSDDPLATCMIELNIVNQDDTALDPSIFSFDPSTNTFTIDSDDIADIDVYNLKVTAKFEGSEYTNIAELPFMVTILDPCATATLMLDSSILSADPIIYNIASVADIQTFTQDKVASTETNCPPFVFTVTD